MRVNRRLRTGAMACVLAVVAVGWAGCSGKTVTEYVAGFSTQVQVPRDLQSIIIRVDVAGYNAFQHDYAVYDGKVRLPRTLGIVDANTPAGTPITVTVYGYSVPDQAAGYQSFGDNTTAPTVGTTEQSGSGACKVGDSVCAAQKYGGARILRASRQPYVPGQIIFLPMPIHFSCYDVDCGPYGEGTSAACQAEANKGETCTCKAGQCVPPDTDPTLLPPFSNPLIYGATNTCFRPFSDQDANGKTQPGCMDLEVAPQPVGDPSLCIFALPGTPSAADAGPYVNPDFPPPLVAAASSGGGLNVRAVFDNLVSEVLDYEGTCPATFPPPLGQKPEEGYCTYADAPQKFRLAPGLCAQYLGQSKSHVITLMEASAACPSKTEFQPICDDSVQGPPQPTLIDGGQSGDGVCNATNPLKPAKSALYVLFDRSSGMRDFFGPTGLGEVLGLSLTNPVFQQTQVGLMYPPANSGDCQSSQNEFALDIQPDAGGVAEGGTVPFEFSGQAQGDIANSLLNQGTADGGSFPSGSAPWFLEAALAGAYSALQNINGAAQFNRRAVMLLVDRDFNVSPNTDCPQHDDAITEAAAALAAGLETYVVYLANADYPDSGVPGQPFTHAKALAGGLTLGGQYFFDSSSQDKETQKTQTGLALASVIADLGSCVYEVPLHFVPGVKLSFPDYAPVFAGHPPAPTVTVSYSPDCLADDATSNPLYVFDNQHIRVCQKTCARLVASIIADEKIGAAYNAPNPTSPTPIPAPPFDVGWGYACGTAIPDASIVESGSAPLTVMSDGGSPTEAGSGDGAVDAATD
jgi:hypothetical protein